MVHTRWFSVPIVVVCCAAFISESTFAASQTAQPQLVKRRTPQKATPVLSKPALPSPLFAQGETLQFSATFNQLDAGGGEIQLRQEKQTDGRDVYRFLGKARTSELIDYLYRRRDTADAIFGTNDYSPLSFLLLSREGNRQREYEVRYDPQTRTLIGSVKRKSRVREQSHPVGNVYDPVSALYRIRSSPLNPGTAIETQIFTGKGLYRFVAQVIKKETVAVGGKKQPALRLRPEVYSLEKDTNENILPQETYLWVSADPLHIPLKLESDTMWGWIVVELDKKSLRAE